MALFPSPRRRHPFYMVEMIRSQPDFVRETLRRLADGRAASVLRGTRHLIVTGCGTSFHAATYGARILQRAFGSRAVVEAVHAYDLAYGNPAPIGAAVVGVSHSGSTPTTNRALLRARRNGHRAFGVCGLSGSPMEDIVEDVFVIGSVHDRSWANTMSYTTQLVAFAIFAAGVAGKVGPTFPRRSCRSLRRCTRRLRARTRSIGSQTGWPPNVASRSSRPDGTMSPPSKRRSRSGKRAVSPPADTRWSNSSTVRSFRLTHPKRSSSSKVRRTVAARKRSCTRSGRPVPLSRRSASAQERPSGFPASIRSCARSFRSCRCNSSRTTRRSHDTRIRTSCGRVFPDFVRAWRRCSTDPDFGRNADDRVRLRAVPQKQVEVHPAAPIRDLEAVHLGLVESRGPPAALRDESRLGDQGQREEAPNPSVARGDWNPVMRRDFLRREALLFNRDRRKLSMIRASGPLDWTAMV